MTERETDPDAIKVTDPTIDALVFTDLHLRATGARFPVAELPVEDHDIVVSLGDVIDDNREHAASTEAGEAYEERGRAFFEALDERGGPVLAVPGNHDPIECTQRLTDGLATVSPLHDHSVAVVADGEWELTIAGWGFEGFDFTSALLAPDYPDIPTPDGHQTPDAVADALLRAAGQYLAGDTTEAELAERLGTEPMNTSFTDSLALLTDRFETIVDILTDQPGPGVVASHASPFGVPFDAKGKHSDGSGNHFGSLALRLAVAASGANGCLSGHTHQRGTTVVPTVDGHAYAHNPGDSGISSVTVHRDGTVRVEAVEVEW